MNIFYFLRGDAILAIYSFLENWPFHDGLNIYCLKTVHSFLCDFSHSPPNPHFVSDVFFFIVFTLTGLFQKVLF